MSANPRIGTFAASAILAAGVVLLAAGSALAHCDSTSGPIIPEAKAALEQGDATPVLKWVREEDEAEIKSIFAKAVALRAKGQMAQELADQYFLETLVRIHRAGEGAPYTGIKDEPVEPIIALADNALAGGSAEELVEKLSAHLAQAVKEKFDAVEKAKAHKDDSVVEGRAFVEAYVTYTHFLEAVHAAIVAVGGHQHSAEVAEEGHGH